MTPIDHWHQAVRDMDATVLDRILADDVIFHSPVLHTPQEGRALTTMYLVAAMVSFQDADFHYVKEIVGDRQACLEFMAEIDGITINGVDIISWNDRGLITEFKVMVRPAKGLGKLQETMKAMLDRLNTSES